MEKRNDEIKTLLFLIGFDFFMAGVLITCGIFLTNFLLILLGVAGVILGRRTGKEMLKKIFPKEKESPKELPKEEESTTTPKQP